jgi:hypothetical protein
VPPSFHPHHEYATQRDFLRALTLIAWKGVSLYQILRLARQYPSGFHPLCAGQYQLKLGEKVLRPLCTVELREQRSNHEKSANATFV